MLAPPVIVILLLTVVWCQFPDDSVQLIDRLNNFFHFDHNIFFMDTSTDLNLLSPSYGNRVVNPPQTIYTFDFDDVSNGNQISTEQMMLGSATGKNQLLIVVVERLKFGNDSRLLAHIKNVWKVDINVKVGVFFAHNLTSLDIVEQWFRWSSSTGIVNIFSAFRFNSVYGDATFNIFNYNPFGVFDWINVTQWECWRDCLFNKMPNYRQYPLQLKVIHGFKVDFFSKELWRIVAQLFNASMSVVHMSFEEFQTSDEVISLMASNSDALDGAMYPFQQTVTRMVVPYSQPYSDFMAYLQNGTGTWMRLIVYTVIVIVLSSLLLIISAYSRRKKISVFQCIADVVNLLANDNSGIRYRNLHCAEVFVTVPLTFTGLIVMNGIVSLFQSYLTSPIYQPQINTFEDLYKSNVTILSPDMGYKGVFVAWLEDITKYGGWNSRIQEVTRHEMFREFTAFNNSIAFPFSNWGITGLSEAQKRLGLKVYYFQCGGILSRTLLSFHVSKLYPFTESLDDIVHRLNAAGLTHKWFKDENEKSNKPIWNAGLSFQSKVSKEAGQFFVPTLVCCGWIASIVVFVCEMIWNKSKRNHLRGKTFAVGQH